MAELALQLVDGLAGYFELGSEQVVLAFAGGTAFHRPEVLEAFNKAGYIRLTTYRKDGTAVHTPVWFVHDGDRLVMRSYDRTFKVRRMLRNPSVAVAPAGPSGDVKGDEVAARAEPLDESVVKVKRRL